MSSSEGTPPDEYTSRPILSSSRPLVVVPIQQGQTSGRTNQPVPTIIRTSPPPSHEDRTRRTNLINARNHVTEAAMVHHGNPGHPSVRKTEFHYEETVRRAEVMTKLPARDWGPFQELADLLSTVNTQSLGSFLALIYITTMVSLATELPPSWMVGFLVLASLILIRVFKL